MLTLDRVFAKKKSNKKKKNTMVSSTQSAEWNRKLEQKNGTNEKKNISKSEVKYTIKLLVDPSECIYCASDKRALIQPCWNIMDVAP